MFKAKAQAPLEYVVIFAVVIAALLIMHHFVKRGYQGSVKASSDRIGSQFSTSGTTIKTETTMRGNETTETEVLKRDDVYTSTVKTGGELKTVTQERSEPLALEKTRLSEHEDFEVSSTINDPDLP